MAMITNFDTFISSLVTTSSSRLLCNVQPDQSSYIYFRHKHFNENITESTWLYLAFQLKMFFSSFLFSLQKNEIFSSLTSPQHRAYHLTVNMGYTKHRNPFQYKQLTSKFNSLDCHDIYDSKAYSKRTELNILHAFITVLHKNDIYLARVFDNVCLPSLVYHYFIRYGSDSLKIYLKDNTKNCAPSIISNVLYGCEISSNIVVCPMSAFTKTYIKLDHLTKRENQL